MWILYSGAVLQEVYAIYRRGIDAPIVAVVRKCQQVICKEVPRGRERMLIVYGAFSAQAGFGMLGLEGVGLAGGVRTRDPECSIWKECWNAK